MPKLSKARPLSNLGEASNVVYCVLADHNLSTDGGMLAFYRNVLKGRVKDIIWIKMPLLELAASGEESAEYMDGYVQEGLEQLAAKWVKSPYHGTAKMKLVLAPAHGTNRGSRKGFLLWSNEHPVHGATTLPQKLSFVLSEALYLGFTFVILFYCHTADDLMRLPGTFDEAVGGDSAKYELDPQPLVVCGFHGIKWAPDSPLHATTSALAFLRQGAPVTKRANVARGYVLTANVNVILPTESNKRVQTFDPVLMATRVRFVGPAGDPPRHKYHDKPAFEARVDVYDKRRCDFDTSWIPRPQTETDLLSFAKSLRRGERVRVAYYVREDAELEVMRGIAKYSADDTEDELPQVMYEEEDGTYVTETLPPPPPCIVVRAQRIK